MFSYLFGSKCVELKAPLRMNITYRPSYWTVLLTQKLRGASGISTELKFKRGEAKTMERGEGEEKRGRLEEFNEHPQWEWERDYLQASRPACREQRREMISKAAEIRGDLPPDWICLQASAWKGKRAGCAYVSVFLSACLNSHWGKCSYMNLAVKRLSKPESIIVWPERS